MTISHGTIVSHTTSTVYELTSALLAHFDDVTDAGIMCAMFELSAEYTFGHGIPSIL